MRPFAHSPPVKHPYTAGDGIGNWFHMMVGVNILALDSAFSGHAIFLRHLLRTMPALHAEVSFHLFGTREGHEHLQDWPLTEVERAKELPPALRDAGVQVLLSPLGHAPAKPGLPQVVYLLDHRPWLGRAQRGWLRRSRSPQSEHILRDAASVVVPSEFLRRLLLDKMTIPIDKVFVAPLGVDEHFAQQKPPIIEGPYLLVVGSTTASRNIQRLMHAFGKLREDFPHTLVVAGRKAEAEPEDWGPQVLRIDSTGQDQLAALYQHCDLFINPSLYEGSAVTVLEAMKAGAPVACGRVGGIPEVAGNVPLYFNAESAESMLGVIRRALQEEPEERQRRVHVGKMAADQYTWEKCASKVLQALRRAFD